MKYNLSDVCSRLSSGKNIRASEISSEGEYPVFGGNGQRGFTNHFNFDGECAIIGRQGAFCGNVRYFSGKAYMTEHAVVVCANDKSNIRYLAYLLSRMQLGRLSGQSAQPGLSVKVLAQQEIELPPIEYQNKIASILGSIEAKIFLNTAINDNLEQQAQALYQELFITNTDPSWETGTISNLGTVIGGSTPSKARPEYYTKNGIAWITPKDLSINKSKFITHGESDITELGLKNSSATVMPEGTVLFSSRAPIGYIAIAAGNITTNQGFKSVVPNAEIGTAYVYYYLKQNLSMIERLASGSTFKEVSGGTMKSVPAIVPDSKTIQEFNNFCLPIFEQQKVLETQNRTLAGLRDSLLPKLMSGELDVSAVEL
ncbi:restriction endonuclease subunit S [Yeguia hominis]|nr:restriction endonuclease subunit S [Yeguia hominis]